jgi:hypothetical protein
LELEKSGNPAACPEISSPAKRKKTRSKMGPELFYWIQKIVKVSPGSLGFSFIFSLLLC